jgi:hypothetical protein
MRTSAPSPWQCPLDEQCRRVIGQKDHSGKAKVLDLKMKHFFLRKPDRVYACIFVDDVAFIVFFNYVDGLQLM